MQRIEKLHRELLVRDLLSRLLGSLSMMPSRSPRRRPPSRSAPPSFPLAS